MIVAGNGESPAIHGPYGRPMTAIGIPRARYLAALTVPLVFVAAGMTSRAPADQSHHQARYKVVNLESLGGTASSGESINDRGWIAGSSTVRGDETRHATLWRHGTPIDLGTLGGPNSSVAWPVKNNRGLIAGIAETAEKNPLKENWSCWIFLSDLPSGHICRGFVWQSGRMQPLPTLGGYNGYAAGANNRGQVVGWAENTVHDPTCNAPQVLQFRAVIWGPDYRRVRELPPLPGDTTSAATAINDRGQVVGISGICDNAIGRFSARHAVRWENGKVKEIGTFGGVAWRTPTAINQRGDVVGFSNTRAEDGGNFRPQAFLWTERGGTTLLGVLPGDSTSQALGINSRRQVVGVSCADTCRAFLWHDGVMTDLNTLVPRSYSHQLSSAGDINEAGRITGTAVDPATGGSQAFVATRTGRHGG